jgi:hypothetical protein|tara:strand:- start:684 stop:977 length:294 start_codon:yes stop_codon:yes gene_type:complete
VGLVKLTEVCHNASLTTQQIYTLQEVFVNPEHVVMIREESRMRQLSEQGALPEKLSESHRFTKLTINRGHTGTEIVVVGAPNIIEKSLNQNKKLIKG